MPLNRKNRVTVKKKKMIPTVSIPRKLYTYHSNGLISNKTLLDDEQFPSEAIIITDGQSLNKNNSAGGCTCRKCGNHNEYAVANQDDGSFICFQCRNI